MKIKTKVIIALMASCMLVASSLPAIAGSGGGGSGGNPNDPKYGNCLSFPVIWAEGVTKLLRGEYGITDLGGEWWYWWGTDSEGSPLSCAPDPDDNTFCNDGVEGTTGPEPGDGISPIYKGYLQQDEKNIWQAGTADASSDVPTVTVETTTVIGNELKDRTYASDYPVSVGYLAHAFIVVPGPGLPEGKLVNFQTWNQATAGSSPFPSAGNIFYAYVLRPMGENEYQVVFKSNLLTVPTLTTPGTSAVAIFPVGEEVSVQEGDVIGFYGQGVPLDVGGGNDILSLPPDPPDEGSTINLDVYSQDRTYSFAAEVSTGGTGGPTTGRVQVDMIDWGDSLESVDWYTKSKVRTEVALIEDSTVNSLNDNENEPFPMDQYEMRHLYGLGINEMWGISTTGEPPVAEKIDPNTQATVYSHCARLTIQKLLVERDNPVLANLIWVPEVGWTEPVGYEVNLINEPIFNKPVWELGDGPSYYSAEVNVKGKVMYGYNWDLNKVHDTTPVPPSNMESAAGDYRVTFSFDDYCGLNNQGPPLNTFFTDADGNPVAQIMELAEEEEVTVTELSSTEPDDTDGGDTPGAVGVIDYNNGLTYMDIRILLQGG